MTTTVKSRQDTIGISPRILLRLEGLAALFGSIALYAHLGGNGWLFILLLLLPDVAMVGYLRDEATGAALYNAVHTYALPVALAVAATLTGWAMGIHLALIWSAHIGLDRTLGYGLKYPTAFKDTHLQRV